MTGLYINTSIVVDKSRGENLTASLNITFKFPRCHATVTVHFLTFQAAPYFLSLLYSLSPRCHRIAVSSHLRYTIANDSETGRGSTRTRSGRA